ncbi:MAG: GNAT family N-acetyltransferase [Erysipelotrichaceae bacterium]|nr:GNAT family N-acetyltransferase [Erysipelotrichaceae bacterium]
MFRFRKCRRDELDKILKLQEDCFSALDNPQWLRRNTVETFQLCLKRPNYCLGCFDGEKLAALGIMQICNEDKENLGYQLDYPLERISEVGNMKLVLVDPAYRGNGLQKKLMDRCEKNARSKNIRVLATTVHPDNVFSVRNIEKCGYVYHSSHEKYGGLIRSLYYKNL